MGVCVCVCVCVCVLYTSHYIYMDTIRMYSTDISMHYIFFILYIFYIRIIYL